MVILSYLYAYKSLTLEELELYVGFLAQANTKEFYTSSSIAIMEAIQLSTDKMINALVELVKKEDKK